MFDDAPMKKEHNITRNLEPLSIDELTLYIKELNAEIARTEAEILKKKAHMDSASSIFKS